MLRLFLLLYFEWVTDQFVAVFACCVLSSWAIGFFAKFKCLYRLYRYSGIRSGKMKNRQRRVTSERDRLHGEIATGRGTQRGRTSGDLPLETWTMDRDNGSEGISERPARETRGEEVNRHQPTRHSLNLSISILPQIHFFEKKVNLAHNEIAHHTPMCVFVAFEFNFQKIHLNNNEKIYMMKRSLRSIIARIVMRRIE